MIGLRDHRFDIHSTELTQNSKRYVVSQTALFAIHLIRHRDVITINMDYTLLKDHLPVLDVHTSIYLQPLQIEFSKVLQACAPLARSCHLADPPMTQGQLKVSPIFNSMM